MPPSVAAEHFVGIVRIDRNALLVVVGRRIGHGGREVRQRYGQNAGVVGGAPDVEPVGAAVEGSSYRDAARVDHILTAATDRTRRAAEIVVVAGLPPDGERAGLIDGEAL